MSEPTETVTPVEPPDPHPMARRLVLAAIVAISAVLAVLLHRSGHTQGDDFALYLRQARSIFDGDIGQVVSDNRFAVLNSDGAFSPIAYPWVWPLLLSPFVHAWGFDYDRLKLVEVATFCLWLVLLHGIVRRRIGWWPAIAVVTVFATAPAYLSHTDQLLTEFPHLAAVALVIWWYDRIRRDATLLTAVTGQLIALGALIALAFNVRRESIVLLGVIGVVVIYDVASEVLSDRRGRNDRRRRSSRSDVGAVERTVEVVRANWQAIVTPFAAFAASAVLAQLLLPTDLLPDNGNSSAFLDDRMAEYPGILSDQLGLGENTAIGVGILLLATVGAVIGLRRRPTLDGPLLLLAVLSALALSTHLRRVDRYWFQVTPWVIYFATVALVTAAGWLLARRAASARTARLLTAAALVPLAALVVAHLVVLPGDISEAQEYNDVGRVQSGPSNPGVVPIFDAVNSLTPPDSIVAYFRARTMTLLTDRRSFQTKHLDRIIGRADYYAERRNSTYWQPDLSAAEARRAGFVEVWSDQRWILWRLPDTPVTDP
ncbi:MAG TPA: hypothetical protein VLN74_03240 [Ilumatobacteraceae bacterium]|nr:hypothetical protein [Ilumatobacteraceae bacterium]